MPAVGSVCVPDRTRIRRSGPRRAWACHAPGMSVTAPPTAPPDRYADAVRARRAELRDARALLLGGHRAALHGCLAGARLTASVELAAALAVLDRELRHHADRGGPSDRVALPGRADAAVARFVDHTAEGWV